MEAAKWPRLAPARVSHGLGPVVSWPGDIGRAVSQLHTGDHAKLVEARNILRRQAFDVNQLVARIARAVDSAGCFESIQRRADASVASGMGERLEAATIQFGHECGEFVGGVEGFTAPCCLG